MDEKVLTLHPAGKQGVRISRVKYETMRTAILDCLNGMGEVDFQELMRKVEEQVAGTFDGSVPWYFTTVKLDLEARGEIQPVRNKKGQLIKRQSLG